MMFLKHSVTRVGSHRHGVIAALCTLIVAMPVSAAEPEVCVVRADGTVVCGTLASWTSERVAITATALQEVPVDEIDELRFPSAKRRPYTSDWIVLGTGDRFPCTVRRIHDDVLTASWSKKTGRSELVFPLENVAAILRQMPPAAAVQRDWLGAIARTPPGKDAVRLVVGEDLTGEFTGWNNGLVEWQSSLGAIQVDLQRIRWIRFDPELTATPPHPQVWWSVFLVDGTRFTATQYEPLKDQSLAWDLPLGGSMTVPRHEIVKATRWSPRRQPLSLRKPAKTEFTPYLDGQRSLTINRSLLHTPLSLRNEESAQGLGMQSRSLVEYAIQPGDRSFRATVGLDDTANGQGSARFSVRVDNRVVWESPELTGQSPAVRLPAIALEGGKTLSLFVDFGEYGDVGDFADWCDASLWQAAPSP